MSAPYSFIVGLVVGGCLFGGTFGVIGWCFGYDFAMRGITAVMRRKADEVGGDKSTIDASWGGR